MRFRIPPIVVKYGIPTAVVLLALGIAWGTADWWRPPLRRFFVAEAAAEKEEEHGHEDGHDHGGHDADTLQLSPQARRNIGLTDGKIVSVALGPYERSVTIPGIVSERPGRTRFQIAAPMTGVVTAVEIQKGEVVRSGKLLFRLRLTHEELVQAQTDFLRTLGELAAEQKEIDRLRMIAEQGVVARKVLLQREYEQDKLEAVLRANRQSLVLHGFSAEQIQSIEKTGDLVSEIEVEVPLVHADMSIHDAETEALREPTDEKERTAEYEETSPGSEPHAREAEFVVAELGVQIGQLVSVGQSMAVLADYRELYVEGRAFEQDAEQLQRAAEQGWRVDAAFENRSGEPEIVRDLPIVYLANEVDPESRAYPFYVGLPNRILRTFAQGRHEFLAWRYKPGQRVNLHVPVEQWTGRIVLPVEAVATDGAESYVFVQNGDDFERRAVHVEYRGQRKVVIANDGSVYLGERVATTGAHQMQMALKNAAGGGADAHHGHHH